MSDIQCFSLHAGFKGNGAGQNARQVEHSKTNHSSFWMFGTLGKPVSTSALRDEERLIPFVYLGPMLSTGGGCVGIVAQEARLDLSEEITKVRRFQTARAVVPCKWSLPSGNLT